MATPKPEATRIAVPSTRNGVRELVCVIEGGKVRIMDRLTK